MYCCDNLCGYSVELLVNRLNPSSSGCTVATAYHEAKAKHIASLNPSSSGCTVATYDE